MGLRDIANQDLGVILNDSAYGFGWPITITDPAGTPAPLTGFSSDIAQAIDPETGQAVSGRLASVAIAIADLIAAGLAIPENIPDSNAKPWLVTFDDINGNSYTFKVSNGNPDRALGVVSCLLEFWG